MHFYIIVLSFVDSYFPIDKLYSINDTDLKVSQLLYCLTTSISHGVESYFLRLWGISDAILHFLIPDSLPAAWSMYVYLVQ